RARSHDHAERAERAGGDGGADVAHVVAMMRETLDVADTVAGLLDDRPLAGRGDHDMRLHVRAAAQDLEKSDSVDRTAGAGDTDDQPRHNLKRRRKTSSRVFS